MTWDSAAFGSLMSEPTRNGIYKPKEFHGRGAKMVNMGELFSYPRLRDIDMRRVELSAEEQAKFGLARLDLLFARRSLVAEGAGKCSIVMEVIEPTAFESSIIRARLNTSVAAPLFYYYFFTSSLGLHALDTIRRQVAVAGIASSDLVKLQVPVPPIATQHAIANLLGTLDDRIELNRRMNETLEAMAQAIFRDWLVDFGPTRRKLAGITDPIEVIGGVVQDADRASELAALFPDSLIRHRMPEGWTERPLLDLASWVNGAAYKNMHFSEEPGALPVVKIAELKAGVTASTKRTNSELGQRYRITDGELLFSWSGNPDTSIDTFVWVGGDAWLNQHIFAVRENGKRSIPFLHTALRYLKPAFAELARNKQTTGLGHVTKDDMSRLNLTEPSPAVIEAIDALIGPIFGRLKTALLETRTLAATRDFLLPKLMSGEIRLRDAEAFVEAAK